MTKSLSESDLLSVTPDKGFMISRAVLVVALLTVQLQLSIQSLCGCLLLSYIYIYIYIINTVDMIPSNHYCESLYCEYFIFCRDNSA